MTQMRDDGSKKEKNIDVEIICSEWQAEKMIYIIEVRDRKDSYLRLTFIIIQ